MPAPNFPISPNDVVELTMISTYQGSQILNVFHYHYDDPGTFVDGVAALRELIEVFKATMWSDPVAGMQSRVNANFRLHFVRAQIVFGSRKPYIQSLDYDEPGSNPGTPMPSDSQMCIDLRPLVVGRGRVGNKKISGLVTSMYSGPYWTPAAVLGMQTFAGQMLLVLTPPITMLNWEPAIWSPANPGRHDRVFEFNVRPEVRVLRRRQVGQGI